MTDAGSEFQTDGAAHRKVRFAKSLGNEQFKTFLIKVMMMMERIEYTLFSIGLCMLIKIIHYGKTASVIVLAHTIVKNRGMCQSNFLCIRRSLHL